MSVYANTIHIYKMYNIETFCDHLFSSHPTCVITYHRKKKKRTKQNCTIPFLMKMTKLEVLCFNSSSIHISGSLLLKVVICFRGFFYIEDSRKIRQWYYYDQFYVYQLVNFKYSQAKHTNRYCCLFVLYGKNIETEII